MWSLLLLNGKRFENLNYYDFKKISESNIVIDLRNIVKNVSDCVKAGFTYIPIGYKLGD